MKKMYTILAALSALLMLTVTSANSLEFKAGVTANGMAAYANAKEEMKGGTRTTNEEAILATSFASVFAEVSSEEMMGLGIGISYAPEVAELDKETRTIQNTSGQAVNDSGDQIIDGKIQDLASIYVTLPIGDTGAYVKAGYMQAELKTNETLATGSKYADITMTGTQLGGGYEGELSDMVFWRAEGSYQMWEDLSESGSQGGRVAASSLQKNKITAEIGSVTGSLSIGMKF